MELLHKVEEDAEGAAAARYLTEEERLGKISALGKDRQKWRMDTVRDAVQTLPDQHQTQVRTTSLSTYSSTPPGSH